MNELEIDEGYLARCAEVDKLVERAQDKDDEYDGHHGSDRSYDSLAYAGKFNPETAARIRRKSGGNA